VYTSAFTHTTHTPPPLLKTLLTNMKGVARFGETLTLVATLYKHPVSGFDAKEYSFKIQVPGKDGAGKMFTVGRADLDLAAYATAEKAGAPSAKMMPVLFKVGATTTGYLKISIAAEMVGAGVDEDVMTAVSGLTGLHSSFDGEETFAEQDLSGARVVLVERLMG